MSTLRRVIDVIAGLVVDDGLLALGTLAAIGAAALLATDGLLGPKDVTGWILVVVLAAVTTASVLRAISQEQADDRR